MAVALRDAVEAVRKAADRAEEVLFRRYPARGTLAYMQIEEQVRLMRVAADWLEGGHAQGPTVFERKPSKGYKR